MAKGRRHRLTRRVVEAAEIPPERKPYFLWDDEVRGFGVRIFASGQRIFYIDYRARDAGRRRRMPIGAFGPLTCEEARRLAKATLGSVEWGEDPALERKTRRSSLTVAALCDRYLEAVEAGQIIGKGGKPKKTSTVYIDRGRIARHIKPLIGARLVIDLTTPDIARFQRDVIAGKSRAVIKTERKRGKAVVEGGAGTARRTIGLLGGILSFALEEGIIDRNPARGVKRSADGVRTRRLTPDEYRALGVALDAAEDDGASWQAVAGVKLLALTGCRLGEIQKLKWSEVDEARGCLSLEDSKQGASTRPAGHAVFDVLNELPRLDDEGYVLPRLRGVGPFTGLGKAMTYIAELAKLEGVTAHTLRHSLSSTAADMGMSQPTIGALLGHAKSGVTSRYIHQLDAVLVAAADRVAAEITRQMAGEAGRVVHVSFSGDRISRPA